MVLTKDRFRAHLETVYRCYHDDRYQGECPRASRDDDDEIYELQKYISRMNSTRCRRAYVNDCCGEDLKASENPLEAIKKGRTKVPRRSMKTKKRMEKRQKPQSSGRKINSHRL